MGKILVTGGAGYIGSHTVVELIEAGYDVVVVDNLSNSSKESLNRVEQITDKEVKFYENDIADMEAMDKKYPNYGFARHKGYGTKAHLEAIEKYGINEEYRKSYKPVQKIIEKQGNFSK